jgi:alpha-tubulin suppressor-like RCC1 family protein
VYSVGHNRDGQLGNGNNNDCKEIKEIEFFKNSKIIDIKSGRQHSLSISKNGEIYGWGYNGLGQLGNKKYDKNCLIPIKIYQINKDLLKKQ